MCIFFPYSRTKRQLLQVYKGTVSKDRAAKFPCKIFIDSGCEQIVAAKQFADKLKLHREKTSLQAELWDGTLVAMQPCTKNLFIQIGEATITVRPHIVDWIAYDNIPGKSWLSEASPKIDWRSNSMKLRIRDRFIALDAECSESESSIQEQTITGKQFSRLTRKCNCKAIHVLI